MTSAVGVVLRRMTNMNIINVCVFPCRQAAEEGHGDGQAAAQQDPEDQPPQPRLRVAPAWRV